MLRVRSVHRGGQTGGTCTTPSHASASPPTEYSILFEDSNEPHTLQHEQQEALPRPPHGIPRHAAAVAPLKGSTAACTAATAAGLAAGLRAEVAAVPPTATMSTEGGITDDVSSDMMFRTFIVLCKVLSRYWYLLRGT